jgi:glycosyltransferase involved in cell wall biosynthesis
MQNQPLFSVVIPTYNRRDSLLHTLQELTKQTCQDFEVIVTIDGSSDGTAASLAQLTPQLSFVLRYFEQTNAGPGTARNRAAKEAQGRYILFIDDDIEALPDLIEQHASIHAQQSGIAVIGTTPAPPTERQSAWASYEDRMFAKHYRKVREGLWQEVGPRLFYTGNSSLAREDFWRVGGFDQSLRRGEDIELGYRLRDNGIKFVLNEKAIGLHLSAPRSFQSWAKIPYKYGEMDAWLDLEKDSYGLVASVGEEFVKRHWLTRTLTTICLERPLLRKVMSRGLSLIAQSGKGKIPQFACSAIFNLNYFQGVVDRLGAAEVWWANTKPEVYKGYYKLENGRSFHKPEITPGISIVVATRNRPDFLKTCLENILASNYPKFELIVADQSDGAESGAVAQAFAHDSRLKYIKLATKGRSRAMNTALPLTQYNIIGFTDDDCRLAPDWLEQVAHVFTNRPEVDLVTGKVIAGPHDPQAGFVPVFEIGQTRYCGYAQIKKPGGYGMGANTIVRRHVLETIGLFDELLGAGNSMFPASEDLDFYYRAYKAGFIHLQTPRIWLWHDGFRAKQDLTKLIIGYNRGVTGAYVKHARLGDWTATRLLGAALNYNLSYSLKRMLKHQPPYGLRSLLESLKGLWFGLKQPLDSATKCYKDPQQPVASQAGLAKSFPPLTMAICTRNRPQDLKVAVKTILETNYPQFEVLVVDQSEKDGGATRAFMQELQEQYNQQERLNIKITYLASPPLGTGYAHNIAVHQAAYNLIAFTDDDCRVPEDWPFIIGNLFNQNPKLGAIVGAVEAAEHNAQAGLIPKFTNFPAGFAGIGRYALLGRGGMGANFAVCRTSYFKVGPFDEALGSGGTLKSGSDLDYFYRVWRKGEQIYYAPECWVWHDGFRPYTAMGQLNARSYFGAAAVMTKNLRQGDLVAALCLLSWISITAYNTALYAMPRLLTGQRPLGIKNLFSFGQGIVESFKMPVDHQSGVYYIDPKHITAWSDDKTNSANLTTKESN